MERKQTKTLKKNSNGSPPDKKDKKQTGGEILIELFGGPNDGIRMSVAYSVDSVSVQNPCEFRDTKNRYSDSGVLNSDGLIIFRCSSKEGKINQSFFD